VYQLHVPDPAVSFDASMETLARLKEQGKVRHVALSNVTLEHIHRAEKIVPIVSVQNRYSFSDREWDFVLDYCKAKGIAFMPWGRWRRGARPTKWWRRLRRIESVDGGGFAGLAAAPLAGGTADSGNLFGETPGRECERGGVPSERCRVCGNGRGGAKAVLAAGVEQTAEIGFDSAFGRGEILQG